MKLTFRTGLAFICLALVILVIGGKANILLAEESSVRNETRLLIKKAHEEISNGQPDLALVSLQSVLDLDPENLDASYLIGKVKFSQGALTEAEDIFRRGMELAPLSIRVKLMLAKVKLAQKAPDEAENLIKEVQVVMPNDAQAFFLLGRVAMARGDTTLTLDLWEKALDVELGANLQ